MAKYMVYKSNDFLIKLKYIKMESTVPLYVAVQGLNDHSKYWFEHNGRHEPMTLWHTSNCLIPYNDNKSFIAVKPTNGPGVRLK